MVSFEWKWGITFPIYLASPIDFLTLAICLPTLSYENYISSRIRSTCDSTWKLSALTSPSKCIPRLFSCLRHPISAECLAETAIEITSSRSRISHRSDRQHKGWCGWHEAIEWLRSVTYRVSRNVNLGCSIAEKSGTLHRSFRLQTWLCSV